MRMHTCLHVCTKLFISLIWSKQPGPKDRLFRIAAPPQYYNNGLKGADIDIAGFGSTLAQVLYMMATANDLIIGTYAKRTI